MTPTRRALEGKRRKHYANFVGADAQRPEEGGAIVLTWTNGSPAPMFNTYIHVHYLDGTAEKIYKTSIGVLPPGTYSRGLRLGSHVVRRTRSSISKTPINDDGKGTDKVS